MKHHIMHIRAQKHPEDTLRSVHVLLCVYTITKKIMQNQRVMQGVLVE